MKLFGSIAELVQLVFRSNSQTVTVNPPASPSGSRTLNLPDSGGTAATTVIDNSTTQTLTNKTLTGNTAANLTPDGTHTVTFPTATDTLVGRATTDTLTNKTLTGNTAANLSPDGTHTLTLPTSTDTLVGKATTDTLTNKTMDGGSNTFTNISTGSLTGVLGTTHGGTGQNSSASFPTSGVIVTETGTELLQNKTLDETTTLNILTSLLRIEDNTDNTKRIRFDLSGNTTGTTRTLTVPNSNTTLVGRDTTDTLTNKTLSGNTATNLVNGSGTLDINSSGTITIPNTTDTLATLTGSETLSNKTLLSPTITASTNGAGITQFNNSGTISIPPATDTLVARNTIDTLTNKTISGSSNTLTVLAGSQLSGQVPIANGGTNVSSVTTTPTATAFAGWDANKNLSANSHISGYATTATAAGTTTLTVSSAQQQYFTGSTTQTVVLPVVSTLVLGQTYVLVNNSSGNVTVQSSGGNTVQVMGGASAATFTVISTSGTGASSWNVEYTAQSAGTVTSVAMTVPTFLSVSGSPVTTSGTLAVSLSGTALPIANGGTNATSASAAFNNLSPMTTTGDIIYGGTAGAGTRLAGSTGVLHSTGAAAPTWSLIVDADVSASAAISGSKLQAASASNSGTISNYSTGTFSPTIKGGTTNPTVSYTNQTGEWIRIGNAVYVNISIAINTISGGSGAAIIDISGIGINSNASSNQRYGYTCRFGGSAPNPFPSGVTYLAGEMSTSNTITISGSGQAASQDLQVTSLENGGTIFMSGFYFTT